jgi:hypothetical protein
MKGLAVRGVGVAFVNRLGIERELKQGLLRHVRLKGLSPSPRAGAGCCCACRGPRDRSSSTSSSPPRRAEPSGAGGKRIDSGFQEREELP